MEITSRLSLGELKMNIRIVRFIIVICSLFLNLFIYASELGGLKSVEDARFYLIEFVSHPHASQSVWLEKKSEALRNAGGILGVRTIYRHPFAAILFATEEKQNQRALNMAKKIIADSGSINDFLSILDRKDPYVEEVVENMQRDEQQQMDRFFDDAPFEFRIALSARLLDLARKNKIDLPHLRPRPGQIIENTFADLDSLLRATYELSGKRFLGPLREKFLHIGTELHTVRRMLGPFQTQSESQLRFLLGMNAVPFNEVYGTQEKVQFAMAGIQHPKIGVSLVLNTLADSNDSVRTAIAHEIVEYWERLMKTPQGKNIVAEQVQELFSMFRLKNILRSERVFHSLSGALEVLNLWLTSPINDSQFIQQNKETLTRQLRVVQSLPVFIDGHIYHSEPMKQSLQFALNTLNSNGVFSCLAILSRH